MEPVATLDWFGKTQAEFPPSLPTLSGRTDADLVTALRFVPGMLSSFPSSCHCRDSLFNTIEIFGAFSDFSSSSSGTKLKNRLS
jgi:hypothetical protein